MNNELEIRHKQIESLIQRLEKAKPTKKLSIFLYPCKDYSFNPRGFVSHEKPSIEKFSYSKLFDEFQNSNLNLLKEIPTLDSLKVGDYIYIAVKSEVDGYLTLFNLGTSGKPVKLFPKKKTAYIAKNRFLFISANDTLSEKPDTFVFQEMGDNNSGYESYPERLLVIVTTKDEIIRLSELMPVWDCFDQVESRNAWDQGKVINHRILLEEKYSDHEWAWGYLEVKVKKNDY